MPSAIVLGRAVARDALPGFAAGDVSVQDVAAQRAAAYLDLRRGSACSTLARRRAARPVTSSKPAGSRRRSGRSIATRARLGAGEREPRPARSRRRARRWRCRAAPRLGGTAGRSTGSCSTRLAARSASSGVIPTSRCCAGRRTSRGAVALQAALLRGSGRCSKPGGRLVYATCTVLRRENDAPDRGVSRAAPDAERAGTEAAQRRGKPARGDRTGTASIMLAYVKRTCCDRPGVSHRATMTRRRERRCACRAVRLALAAAARRSRRRAFAGLRAVAAGSRSIVRRGSGPLRDRASANFASRRRRLLPERLDRLSVVVRARTAPCSRACR